MRESTLPPPPAAPAGAGAGGATTPAAAGRRVQHGDGRARVEQRGHGDAVDELDHGQARVGRARTARRGGPRSPRPGVLAVERELRRHTRERGPVGRGVVRRAVDREDVRGRRAGAGRRRAGRARVAPPELAPPGKQLRNATPRMPALAGLATCSAAAVSPVMNVNRSAAGLSPSSHSPSAKISPPASAPPRRRHQARPRRAGGASSLATGA